MYDGGHKRPLQRCFEAYTVAGLLKQFLLESPKPLLSRDIVRSFLEQSDGSNAPAAEFVFTIQKLVTQISTCERRTLKYIMFYLNRSCQQKSVCLTNSSRRAVARIFVPILFKDYCEGETDEEGGACDDEVMRSLERILELMIDQCEQVFFPFSSTAGAAATSVARERRAPGAEEDRGAKIAGNGGEAQRDAGAAATEVKAKIDSRISDAVGSLFGGFAAQTAPGHQHARSQPVGKHVLNEHPLNVVKQKISPEMVAAAAKDAQQDVIKPKIKPDFTHAPASAAAQGAAQDAMLVDIDDLSHDDLLREKKRIKRAIRIADNVLAKKLGRKPSQLEKEPLRPMYSRYWKIKRSLETPKTQRACDHSVALEILKF